MDLVSAIQPPSSSIVRGLRAVGDAELFQNVGDVCLDGILADKERLGNFPVAHALTDFLQDLLWLSMVSMYILELL